MLLLHSKELAMKSKLPFAGALIAASAIACSDGNTSSTERGSTVREDLSPSASMFVSVRRDHRKCASPKCGGYYLRALNQGWDEFYVSALDVSDLENGAAHAALSAPDGELVLRGTLSKRAPRFDQRAFHVEEAYRGMPGVNYDDAIHAFFQVAPRDPPIECFAAPCPNLIATYVNHVRQIPIDSVNVDKAGQMPQVDRAWLAARAEQHGAIAVGWLRSGAKYPGGEEVVFDAAQVFVRVPDPVGPCPMMPTPLCDEGKTNVVTRNANRCHVPTGCVHRGICPMYMPACGAGYTLQSWATAPTGCEAFACDPAFLYEEQQK
jgi:hypothetical protein